jgi:hypothetical protein
MREGGREGEACPKLLRWNVFCSPRCCGVAVSWTLLFLTLFLSIRHLLSGYCFILPSSVTPFHCPMLHEDAITEIFHLSVCIASQNTCHLVGNAVLMLWWAIHRQPVRQHVTDCLVPIDCYGKIICGNNYCYANFGDTKLIIRIPILRLHRQL